MAVHRHSSSQDRPLQFRLKHPFAMVLAAAVASTIARFSVLLGLLALLLTANGYLLLVDLLVRNRDEQSVSLCWLCMLVVAGVVVLLLIRTR